MSDPPSRDAVADALQQINRTWLEGRPRDLAPFLHPAIVMVFPGFSGRAEGAEALMAGFVDFCDNAEMQEYGESDLQIDVTGDTAVASYAFDMLYKRSSANYRATGRDLWVFSRQGGKWLAVWRTMLDLAEHPVQ
jgi:ketosteroid isomerase-like protein